MRRAALVLVAALTLTGCETTAEKSAKLERQALRSDSGALAAKGLSIAHASAVVRVVDSAVLHSSEGTAAAITLRNDSGRALADIPLAIAVHDPQGSSVYSNSAPGLAHSLVSVPLIAAHGELTWIDDQVTGAGASSSATAEAGEGKSVSGAIPAVSVEGTHLFEESGSGFAVKGNVVNRSGVEQHELVVYATARKAGKVVAAGRAVLPLLAPGASVAFEVFFIGDPTGAQLQVSAPPSTLP